MKGKGLCVRLLSLALFLVIAVCTASGIGQAAEKSRETELESAYESIRRAIVTCYAIEGRYPESYAYLKEHYPVRIDEEKYTVVYTAFASNLMPDVTILAHGE